MSEGVTWVPCGVKRADHNKDNCKGYKLDIWSGLCWFYSENSGQCLKPLYMEKKEND